MPKYNLDELLQKDKQELDRIKTAIDIYQSDDKYAFERKKFRADNIRLVVVAILSSVISLGSALLIERFRQAGTNRSDIKKEFASLKVNYLQEDNAAKRKEIACAISEFDNILDDRVIATEQEKYIVICESASDIAAENQSIASVDTSSQEVKDAITQLDALDTKLQDLKEEKKTASADQQAKIDAQIKSIDQSIDTITNKVPSVKQAVIATSVIQQKVKQIDSVDKSIAAKQKIGSATQMRANVSWVKPGSYTQFGNYRIDLTSASRANGATIKLCRTNAAKVCERTIAAQTVLTLSKSYEFSDGTNKYRVTLKSIDHAGKNPFTLAAYISFETL